MEQTENTEPIKNKGGRPKKKHPGGRPTVLTPETIQKLEEAFALGASDGEACFFADISNTTLYNYQLKNPGFIERKNSLKESPILKARTEVINGFKGNPELALKYLERKRKKEFSLRTENETEIKGEVEVIIKLPEE